MNSRLVLIGLAFSVFIVLRAATLVTSLEALSWDEELHRGTIARELTVGLKAPFWDYRADSYSGGALVVGLLAAPLFWAFGPRLIVLKLVPLAISLVTLGLLIAVLDRYHSRRAAWVGASLFVLAPPSSTQLSFLAMGYHTESIVFSALLILVWARALERPEGRAPFWLGLIAGLAFSFTYITVVTTLGCLLCSGSLLRRAGAGPKFAAGLALGLAPWTAYNLTHHWDGVRIAQVWFTPPAGVIDSVSRFVLRLGWRGAMLLGRAVPLSYGFPAMLGIPGSVWSYAYFGLTLVPIVWLLRTAGARPFIVRPPLASAVVFLVLYPFTRFGIPIGGAEEFRHFVPFQFALLTPLAIALIQAPFGKAAAAALMALGAMGQATLPLRDPAPHAVDYRGYSYFVFGHAWADRIDPVAPATHPLLSNLDERTARLVYWGALDVSSAKWAVDPASLQRIHEVPAGYRPYFAEAVGGGAGTHQVDFRGLVAVIDAVPLDVREHFTLGYIRNMSMSEDAPLPDIASARELPLALRRWCHFSLGGLVLARCVVSWDHSNCRSGVAAVEAIDPDAASGLYRGAGSEAASYWLAGQPLQIARIGPHDIPPPRRADFAWGLGWGIRGVFKEDLPRAHHWLARLGPVERAAALDGVRAYDAFYRLEPEPGAPQLR